MRPVPLIGVLVLLMAGCAKEDPAWPPLEPLSLTVRPTWNGSAFDKHDIHLTAADERVLISQAKFFLSGITVIGRRSTFQLSQVELLDITNGSQVRSMSVPAGDYDSLRFGLGLPPELNHQDITQVVPPSPLDFSQGMYWSWATMYRFLLFDGTFDAHPDSTGAPTAPFSIHTGRDQCFRVRTVGLPLKVAQQDTARITLEVDLARFFSDGNEILRLSDGGQSHGGIEELPLAERLSDLAVKAINAQ